MDGSGLPAPLAEESKGLTLLDRETNVGKRLEAIEPLERFLTSMANNVMALLSSGLILSLGTTQALPKPCSS